MAYCLPVERANKFIAGLKDGSINPGNLAEMSSADRRAFFQTVLQRLFLQFVLLLEKFGMCLLTSIHIGHRVN